MKKLGGFLVSGAGGDHLPTEEDGMRSHRLMGEAHAALFGGFHGNNYEGPNKAEAIAKLKAMYAEEKMPWPGAMQQSGDLVAVRQTVNLGEPKDAAGNVWLVEITQYGQSKAGLEWPPEVCARDAQVFQHVRSHADHAGTGEIQQTGGHSIRNLIGWIENPQPGDKALTGELHLLEPEVWSPKLRALQKAPAGIGGMSLDALVQVERIHQAKGAKVRVARIVAASSVDLVSGPAGGGQILRAVASVEDFLNGVSPSAEHVPTAGAKAGGNMKEKIARILQAIKRFDPAKAGTLETEIASLEEQDQLERVTQALAAIEPPKPAEPEKPAAAPALSDADRATLDQATLSIKEARVIQCSAILQKQLAASGLPVPLVEEIERRFKDKVFDEKDLLEDIKQVRQAYARVVPAHRVTDPSVRITMQEEDKLQVALHKAFGLTHDVKVEVDERGFERVKQGNALPTEIPAFRGIREAYTAYTGDPDVTGQTKLQRITQIFNVAGFPFALAATLNRLLLKDYGAVDYRARDIVTSVTAPSDFKTQERIRVGYFGDLDVVADDGEYTEIDEFTDEKIAYAVGTYGNIATATRRAIINDDLQVISKIVSRLARSAARTLARFEWGFAISNATYDADATAWFHANHNNLGAVALGNAAAAAAEMNVIDAAFFNQTEKDSGEVLALSGPYLLVVPKALHSKAIAFNQSQYTDDQFTSNPWYHRFGVSNENIFANPFMTDATDWLVFDISGNVDILEIGFLQGRQTPEFFQADNPTVDQMFTQDRLRYKVRHEYSGDILDFRGAFKEVVA